MQNSDMAIKIVCNVRLKSKNLRGQNAYATFWWQISIKLIPEATSDKLITNTQCMDGLFSSKQYHIMEGKNNKKSCWYLFQSLWFGITHY